jgi:uncharacterized protein (DUF1330 family)
MPKGYIVVTEDIKDPEGFKAYMGEAAKAMGEGVAVLSFDPKPEVLEGNWHGPQTILMEFESVDAARDWYNSDLYQAAAKLRQAAADCNVAIISGL